MPVRHLLPLLWIPAFLVLVIPLGVLVMLEAGVGFVRAVVRQNALSLLP